MTKRIAVIGGGIAGTAAARELVAKGYEVTILERSDRLGGRIRSESFHESDIELGAGFISSGYTHLRQYLKDGHMQHLLRPHRSKTRMYRRSGVVNLSVKTALGNDLLSTGAKFQLLSVIIKTLLHWPQLDIYHLSKASQLDSQSVSKCLPSKSGQQLLESAIQPTLNGYCYWNPEQTSYAMMLLLCRAAFSHATTRFDSGLQQIPVSLARGATTFLNTNVMSVHASNDRFVVTAAQNGAQKRQSFDGIVCAITATAVSRIFQELTSSQKKFFDAVEYSSTALVADTYRFASSPGNQAIAFPRQEGTHLASITVATVPAKGGSYLTTIKTYASGAIGKDLSTANDAKVLTTLRGLSEEIIASTLRVRSQPKQTIVQKWPEAIPLFDVGHFKRLKKFDEGKVESRSQAIVFSGDYIGGPFMEGAYVSGVKAADRLINKL